MSCGEREKAAKTEHTSPLMYDEIWLQCPNRDSMSEWYGEVTWAEDQINDDDTKYVRADIAESLKQQRDELLAALENCRLLAARHRKEEWAGHVLRFCGEAGLKGEVMRDVDKETLSAVRKVIGDMRFMQASAIVCSGLNGHKQGEWCERRYQCAAHETIKHDAGIHAPAAFRKCNSDLYAAYLPLAGFHDEDSEGGLE